MPSTHFEDSLLHQNYNSSPPPGHFNPTLYPQPISFETPSRCLSPSRIEIQTPRVPSGNPYPDPEEFQSNHEISQPSISGASVNEQSEGDEPEHQSEEQDDGSNDQFSEEEDHQVHTEEPAIYEQWARTEAQRYLLHQTSPDHIARYSQIADPRKRNITMMAMLASVKEVLEKNDDFKLSELGKKQINTYCAIILLTPDLESYKGDAIETLLVAKLKEAGSGLPLGWKNDPVKFSLIKSAIKSDLTGIHSEMKKKIRASRGYIKDGKTVPAITISDLAKLLAGDSVTLNATHWARFAYLRRIYPHYTGENYWDEIDKALEGIRKQMLKDAKDNHAKMQRMLNRYFSDVLKQDYKEFGCPANPKYIEVPEPRGETPTTTSSSRKRTSRTTQKLGSASKKARRIPDASSVASPRA
ncbi:hypothetical protein M422DRAFT_275028 [Sphaerobolus stellatus SS14]|uniref:Uncharacterized protein n=1 Tax=Sphaerobolus stellatus (strain SS14) TaxID=990650 RepID=A0A0C9TQL7_SPHS4|nr:hypothetical protein M422DRAFT_275028 [Sphaerobolus stellatus SS14]